MISAPACRWLPHRSAVALLLLLPILAAPLAILLYDTGACAQVLTDKQAVELMERLDPEERQEIEAMWCILSPAQFNELLTTTTPPKRRRWIDSYWNSRDPNFATDENENRIEHNRRVEHARMYFLVGGWPAWDDRGEVYIRYGHPDVMATIQEEVNPGGVEPPREVWYYAMHDMFVRFEDPFRRGDFSYYQEHVHAPPGERMDRVDQSISAPMVPELLPPEIAVLGPYEQFMKKTRRFYEVMDATPSTYAYDFDVRSLPFAFSVDNFRGGDSVNRVDVNFEFMAERSPLPGGRNLREYVAAAVFRDFHGRTADKHESSIRVPTGDASAGAQLVPVQLSFSVPPGFYAVGITLQERTEDRLTSYKTDFTCPNMDRGLIVSDIVTASVIEEVSGQSPFNRGALRVVPHPSGNYRQPAVIPIYFEVYNLTPDERGVSTYQIEYEVESDRNRPRGFWGSLFRRGTRIATSSRFEASAYGSQDVVRLNLSTENLWMGVFTLRVAIEDLTDGAMANQEVGFRILE